MLHIVFPDLEDVEVFCSVSSNFPGMLVGQQSPSSHPKQINVSSIQVAFFLVSGAIVLFYHPPLNFMFWKLVPWHYLSKVLSGSQILTMNNKKEGMGASQRWFPMQNVTRWLTALFFFFFGQSGWAKGECLSEGWKEGSLSSAMMLKPLVLFLSLVMRFLALKWMVGMHFLWWNMHRILDLDFVV